MRIRRSVFIEEKWPGEQWEDKLGMRRLSGNNICMRGATAHVCARIDDFHQQQTLRPDRPRCFGRMPSVAAARRLHTCAFTFTSLA